MTTMTMSQLVAKYNELAAKVGKPARKGFDNKTAAEGAIGALTLMLKSESKGAKLKIAKAKRSVTVHEKGPRGFKFGPVWMESIRTGKGVALKPQNMPKLMETAQHFSVDLTPDLDQREIAAAIAQTISKP